MTVTQEMADMVATEQELRMRDPDVLREGIKMIVEMVKEHRPVWEIDNFAAKLLVGGS